MGFFSGDSGLLGGVTGALFGGQTDAEKRLKSLSTTSLYSGDIQRFLPMALRAKSVDPYLQSGMENIGALLNNPGGMNPNVADALRPFLAQQSQQIAQNYRGLESQQAGAAARSNLPVSIKNALAAALGTQQERSQREAQTGALGQSEQLRRSDLDQFYKLLDSILQYTSAGRGIGVQGLAAASGTAQQRQADQMKFTSDIIGSVAGMMGGAAGV